MKKVEISNPNKILFPKKKITKGEIINYYDKISGKMLPFLKNRLLTLKRYPNGVNKKFFYQKNKSDYFPNWIKTYERKGVDYVICNNKETLIYLANQASLEIHSWLSRVNRVDNPDKMILDLDPSKEGDNFIVKGAMAIKKILDEIGLQGYPLLTGSKGIHIIVPVKPNYSFEYVRDFARKIAEIVSRLNPEKFTTEMSISKRKGRIFIDSFRNSRAQTAIVPYSLRAVEEASVAAPVNWDELRGKFSSKKYDMNNIFRNLDKKDWGDFHKKKFSLDKAEKKLNSIWESI